LAENGASAGDTFSLATNQKWGLIGSDGSLQFFTDSSTGLAKVLSGTGTPEGVVTAEPGSLFLRQDGSGATALYRKGSGSGNTNWETISTTSATETLTNKTIDDPTLTGTITGSGADDATMPETVFHGDIKANGTRAIGELGTPFNKLWVTDIDIAGDVEAQSTPDLGGGGAPFGNVFITKLYIGANETIQAGSGAPENVVSGDTGCLYIDTGGGAGATLYVKESSPTATTGWVAK